MAAQGDHHFAVRKEISDNRTASRVTHLNGPARRDEIARMLGGVRTSATTLQHAAELLDDAAAG